MLDLSHRFFIEMPAYLAVYFEREKRYLFVDESNPISRAIYFRSKKDSRRMLPAQIPADYDPTQTERYFNPNKHIGAELRVTPQVYLYLMTHAETLTPKIVKILRDIFFERLSAYVEAKAENDIRPMTATRLFMRRHGISEIEHLPTVRSAQSRRKKLHERYAAATN